MMNNFTPQEIIAAQRTREAIKNMDSELKAIYMAGEICMWDEIIQSAVKDIPVLNDILKCQADSEDFGMAIETGENVLKLFLPIITKERVEKEELGKKVEELQSKAFHKTLKYLEQESKLSTLRKENDDLADKYGKSVEENLDLKEKLIELRKENEQLKGKLNLLLRELKD